MTYRKWTKRDLPIYPGSGTKVVNEDYSLVSSNSLKVNGKLALRPNSLQHFHAKITYLRQTPESERPTYFASARAADMGGIPTYCPLPRSELSTRVRARFDGKLRKGSASLGVTIASWKQSRDMVVKRMRDAQRALDRTYMRLSRDRRLVNRIRKDRREPLADQILETEFGWLPLIEDVRTSLTTMWESPTFEDWVKASANAQIGPKETGFIQLGTTGKYEALMRGSFACKVRVDNPNLWLANRAGLVNLPGIAWDLVPWSFVVNMFGNFNQIISSMTAYAGLTLSDLSYTETTRMLVYYEILNNSGGSRVPAKTLETIYMKEKTRTLNQMPPLTLVLKVPELNWNLALIASSLVVQKIKRINQLIRVF